MITAHEPSLLLAVLVGFGFGFVLERAGFGRSTKLAAQFYLYDMTVFKVMFGAIVTAMLGMVLLSQLGMVDLKAASDFATSPTFIWPMVVGGLLLGFGFIIAGYCPGTSLVAAASGNIDGVVAFTGVVLGTVLYSEAFPLLEKFHNSGYLGNVYLYELLRLPPPVVALLVVAMAVGCFIGAEKVEAIFRRKLGIEIEKNLLAPAPRRFAFAGFVAAALLGILTLALPHRPAIAGAAFQILDQQTLAARILENPWSLRLLDLRSLPECERKRIPGSECAPLENLKTLGLSEDTTGTDLVLVTQRGGVTIPAELRGYAGRVFLLENGFEGWSSFALSTPVHPGPQADRKTLEQYKIRSAIFTLATGTQQAAPPPPRPATSGAPAGAKKKGGGCSG